MLTSQARLRTLPDVRCRGEAECCKWTNPKLLTHLGHSTAEFAALHSGVPGVVMWGSRPEERSP